MTSTGVDLRQAGATPQDPISSITISFGQSMVYQAQDQATPVPEQPEHRSPDVAPPNSDKKIPKAQAKAAQAISTRKTRSRAS
jgi:hypothetical protein